MEEWKDIPGFDLYQISNLGRVRRVQYLSPCPDGDGYMTVCLSKGDTQHTKKIHRLIGESFISNPENKPQIDHINRNKLDNSLSNLRWVSSSENNMNREPPRSKDMLHIYISNESTYRVRIKRLKIDKTFKTFDDAKAFRDASLQHS